MQPSTGPWFATARNVALFGNTDGSYDELAAYLQEAPVAVSLRPARPADPRPSTCARWAGFDDAERTLRTALADGAGRRRLLLALAAVLLSARRFDEGLAAAAAAIAAAPDDERGHRIRALLLSGLGRHRGGGRVRVPRGHPGPGLADRGDLAYSMLLQGAGRLRDAEQVAHRAVELAPQSADAHFQLADVTSDLGDRATRPRGPTPRRCG